MPRRRPLPAHLADVPFDRAALAAAKVSPGRLRDADVSRPYHGVQTTSTPSNVLERCGTYMVRMREGQFFSHVTAAQLLGFPMPAALEQREVLDVSAVLPAMPPRTRNVIGHRLRRRPTIVRFRGMPITSAPETWCQLCDRLDDDELVVVADFVFRLWPDEPDQVRAALLAAAQRSGRVDRDRLLAALDEARPGSASPGETRVRLLLMRAGLPEPELNKARLDEFGGFLGSPDLAWPERLVALEYEGDHHFTDARQYRKDVQRYESFRDAGWTVVRVLDADLRGSRAQLLVERMRRLLRTGSSGDLAVRG
jgi:hypothetical protein